LAAPQLLEHWKDLQDLCEKSASSCQLKTCVQQLANKLLRELDKGKDACWPVDVTLGGRWLRAQPQQHCCLLARPLLAPLDAKLCDEIPKDTAIFEFLLT
jgi:hypothetical protein